MPDPTQVSILKRDGSQVYYSTYTAAKNVASSANRDTIMIWANLKDGTAEQIVLKDKVDIWIAEGVIIDYNPSSSPGPTITDNNVAVDCRIYGMGIIKNSYGSSPWYECVKISNASSKVSIECDYIEGIGGVVINPPNNIDFYGFSVRIENASKFHLTCNRVSSQKSVAVWVGVNSTVNDVNLQINSVDTGLSNNNNTGSSAVLISGIGFVTIKEILCRNAGHCLSIRGGNVIAKIEKMTSIMNYTTITLAITTVHVDQGSGTQKLILYFDEIQNLSGQSNAALALEHKQGTGIFIGRSIFSENSAAQISNPSTKGFVKVNQIVALAGTAMILNDFTNEITIDSNYIEGNATGDGGTIFSFDSATFVIKNASIKNKNSGSSVKGLGLFKNNNNGHIPNVTLWNSEIISNGAIIHYNTSSPAVNIKNYGLIGNKDKEGNINLQVGTFSNYVFTYSSDLT